MSDRILLLSHRQRFKGDGLYLLRGAMADEESFGECGDPQVLLMVQGHGEYRGVVNGSV